MVEIAFLVIVVLLSALVFWFIAQLSQVKKGNADLQAQLLETEQILAARQTELEQKKFELVELATENRTLRERMEQDRTDLTERQKELKEQLELVGKAMIQQGTKQLQTENNEQLSQLLTPFKEKIAAFEKEIRENKLKDMEQFATMKEMVQSLSKQHAEMNSTAQNLADALRGEQKVQGDWGELALERILETSGLENGREYKTQDSFKDEHGNHLRPDVVVYLPEEKHLIIDSKVSLKAFEQYINSDDDALRKQALANHILSIKSHIRLLGEKNYSYISDLSTPDFVLMFIPLESSFALAIKEEPDLYQQAWDRKVVLVTPSTLLATLKTVSSIWKQEKQTKNAIEIAAQAARLYDKFIGFLGDMEKIGQKQKDAQDAFDSAMNKLQSGKGNLIGSAQKLKDLGVKSKKELDKRYLEE